jgi:hypothetical protein
MVLHEDRLCCTLLSENKPPATEGPIHHIAIDRGTLAISIDGNGDAFVPLTRPIDEHLAPLEAVLRYDVLYRAVYAADRRRGRKLRYSLTPADPWLVTLTYLAWQGVVQGMSWDGIKAAMSKALEIMRQGGVAPPKQQSVNRRLKRSQTTAGFSYTKYAEDGRKQYHLFLGVKRKFESLSSVERAAISDSFARRKRKGHSTRRRRGRKTKR